MVNKRTTRRHRKSLSRVPSSHRKNIKSRKIIRGGTHTPRASNRSPTRSPSLHTTHSRSRLSTPSPRSASSTPPRSPSSPGPSPRPKIKRRRLVFPDGTIYIGDVIKYGYKHGYRHGRGKVIWTNGDTFIGHFVYNKRHGYGKDTSLNDDGTFRESYEGNFENDKPHGKGTYTWDSGKVYKGNFVDGKAHGKGEYIWPNGASYKGNVIDNQIDYKDKNAVWKWPGGKKYHGALSEMYTEDDLDAISEYDTADERDIDVHDIDSDFEDFDDDN